jgi:tRNA A-37 threonylcarbamoyl transferase component Bud32
MTVANACQECGAPLAADAPEGMCPTCLLGLASLADHSPEPGTTPFPSAGFIAPSPAELAGRFPQLEILELLGQGGMGAVYKARQPKLDRLVAVKILPPEWGKDPAFSERFAREAKALARLTHPHIVAVHDFGESGGLFYLVMEYVDGANLRHLLQEGRMKPAEALAVIPQICDALQYAHEEGVVHRDIKPENILLDSKGRVKIADFGLAKLLNRPRAAFTLTGSQQVMGTLDYMAPEQRLRPQEVDHRADIYSLGVVFYEMLTGELPLGRFEPPSHKARVDARLDEIVFRALEREPQRRYQRASHVKLDVESLANGRPVARRAEPPLVAVAAVAENEGGIEEYALAGPAAGLFVTGLLGMLFWTILGFALFMTGGGDIRMRSSERLLFLLMPLLGIPSGLVLMLAARRMGQMRDYYLCLTASIWAMMPWSAAWLIGLVSGIFALKALHRPGVQAGFSPHLRQRHQVLAPAVGMMLAGILGGIFWNVMGLSLFVTMGNPRHPDSDRYLFLLMMVGGTIGAAILIRGAYRMMKLKSYHSSVMAGVWACIPWSPAWVMALPFGIWALRVLGRREVQIAFGQPFERHDYAFDRPMAAIPVALPASEPPQPAAPARRGVRAFVGSMYSLMFHSRVDQPASAVAHADRSAEPAPMDRGPAPLARHVAARQMAMRVPPRERSKVHTALWVFGLVAVVTLLVGGVVAIFSVRQAGRWMEMRAFEEHGSGKMTILGGRYRDLVTTVHLDRFGLGEDVRQVFESTEAEYLALEARFTKRERKEGNRIRVTIRSFEKDAKDLEKLFFDKLQSATHGSFMVDIHRQLPENRLFPFGRQEVRIELWREDGQYHGKVSQEVLEGQPPEAKMVEKAVEEFSGPALPPMYKRFWIEPNVDRQSQQVLKK